MENFNAGNEGKKDMITGGGSVKESREYGTYYWKRTKEEQHN